MSAQKHDAESDAKVRAKLAECDAARRPLTNVVSALPPADQRETPTCARCGKQNVGIHTCTPRHSPDTTKGAGCQL